MGEERLKRRMGWCLLLLDDPPLPGLIGRSELLHHTIMLEPVAPSTFCENPLGVLGLIAAFSEQQ
jgi:hypothetical protein